MSSQLKPEEPSIGQYLGCQEQPLASSIDAYHFARGGAIPSST